MIGPAEALERRIDDLRVAVRRAVTAGERDRARALRAELRGLEQQWDEAIADLETEHAEPAEPARSSATAIPAPRQPAAILPLREQVHQALILLGVPAAPRLVIAVHQAFETGTIVPARLTSLRRDEERSFRTAPFARPYYLCSALSADLLAPARALLAVSTWPTAARIVGPLSPRVHFLTSAIRLADHVERTTGVTLATRRLLWQFAANIPGGGASADVVSPERIAAAARAELAIHEDADRAHREAAAERARSRLDEAEQLFGSRLRTITATG